AHALQRGACRARRKLYWGHRLSAASARPICLRHVRESDADCRADLRAECRVRLWTYRWLRLIQLTAAPHESRSRIRAEPLRWGRIRIRRSEFRTRRLPPSANGRRWPELGPVFVRR